VAKSEQKISTQQLLDAGAFVLSLWFVYSVINNARDLIEQNVKNAPASYALILALIFIALSWYRSDKKHSVWNIVTLTVLATSVVIWLFGLSTRAA
jgi:hypothetical protein